MCKISESATVASCLNSATPMEPAHGATSRQKSVSRSRRGARLCAVDVRNVAGGTPDVIIDGDALDVMYATDSVTAAATLYTLFVRSTPTG